MADTRAHRLLEDDAADALRERVEVLRMSDASTRARAIRHLRLSSWRTTYPYRPRASIRRSKRSASAAYDRDDEVVAEARAVANRVEMSEATVGAGA